MNTYMKFRSEMEEKDKYIDWLENVCLAILSNGKKTSTEKIIKKIKENGINIEDNFIDYLIKKLDGKQKESEIIRKLPLLKTYPIGLEDDIYFEDEEKIYKWEIRTIKELLFKLLNQYKGKDITPEIYYDFFNREIKPYKEYLNTIYDEIYRKILPETMSRYWSYRIDKTISWDKSWDLNNVGISVISMLENNYLDKDSHMEDYRNFIGD